MTNQTSPAAVPAAGFPNTMPDIIDSLKRLERIGDESSKTVEKIIKAAEDLEKKIASQYKRSDKASIHGRSVLLEIVNSEKCSLIEAAKRLGLDHNRVSGMNYTIEWNDAYDFGVRSGEVRVSANREAALAFAADVANGLLILIERDLKDRSEAEEQALRILSNALPEQTEEDSGIF